ncbi:gluconate 2-dehydrogenase subunit 3 family protein [Aquimarina sp. AU119]|uniref:gluconate 2-dehydrogenase subunit 3 family protein n=1 Tax=Aquimarina sp. AU119 TaxID=2108528 RepID=UPI000D695EE8|nr:gluconate 2-dehydrogenase subunit 3 family protein [Aquimarina sp. AU119]
MERRELIKLITLATGGVISIPLSSSLLTACKKIEHVKDSDYKLYFFNKKEFSFVQNLLGILLPKSDSPSATDVGVHQIMDTMIGTIYNPAQQKRFTDRFTALTEFMGYEAQLDEVKLLLESDNKQNKLAKTALLDIKQQAVTYYLSTKEIATNYLNYLPIPGEYEACISLESIGGKAWAL